MKVQFIGVGEAFDETQSNNSQLLEWPGCRLLIDCGYAVPISLWKLRPDPDLLDAIYLSHRHADHYFGLPSYLIRLGEEGRTRDIEVLCPQGMKNTVLEMIEYAYQGTLPKLDFQLVVREVNAGEPLSYRGATLQFAPSSHPVKNFAIAVTVNGKKYAYSGDGNFTSHTRQLYQGCSVLVHETYDFEVEKFGHACITNVVRMAEDQQVKLLVLTHLNRDLRKKRLAEIREHVSNARIRVLIPEVGETLEVEA